MNIDDEKIEQLASLFLSTAEIAAVLECSPATLQRNFAAALKKGRDRGGVALKRIMFQKAVAGDTTMLIWLSKNYLGMADKPETSTDQHQNVNVVALKAMTPKQRRERIFELCQKLNLLSDAPNENERTGHRTERESC